MKRLKVLFASLAWACVAMFPAAALADDLNDLDDLEVTMEVLDAESDFDETISEMRGPDNDDIEFDDQDVVEGNVEDVYDGIENDEDSDGDDMGRDDDVNEEDEMGEEDDFEDGEDVDDDVDDDDVSDDDAI